MSLILSSVAVEDVSRAWVLLQSAEKHSIFIFIPNNLNSLSSAPRISCEKPLRDNVIKVKAADDK